MISPISPFSSVFPPVLEPQRKAEQPFEGLKQYAELTEYLSQADLEILQKRLNELPEVDVPIGSGNWNHLFRMHGVAFPALALKCLLNGSISSMQFATSQLFYNVWAHPNNQAEFVSIFDRDKPTELARSRIDETMKLASASRKAYFSKERPLARYLKMDKGLEFWDIAARENWKDWTLSEEEQFYQILLQMPPSEHHFILVEDPVFKEFKDVSVIQLINFKLGFNVFSRLIVNEVPMCMIPSRGMMQAYLVATRGENAFKPVYRLGLSRVEGMYETLKRGERDMFQAFALLPEKTPAKVDGFPAFLETAEADLHDFYHQMRSSDVPREHVKLFCLFAGKLLELAKNDSQLRQYASLLAQGIIDMEHTEYFRHLKGTRFIELFAGAYSLSEGRSINKFWKSIEACSLITILTHPNRSRSGREEYFLIVKLARWFKEDKTEIEHHFGMSLEAIFDHQIFEGIPYHLKNSLFSLQ